MKLYFPDTHKIHAVKALKQGYEHYDPQKDKNLPCVFILYFEEDYQWLCEHRGQKYVSWRGTDVMRFKLYYFEKYGKYLIDPRVKHICLNYQQKAILANLGINASVIYSTFTDIKKYKPCFKPGNNVYMTITPGREAEYGLGYFMTLAKIFDELEFHIFGIEYPLGLNNWHSYNWMLEDDMDKIIADFQLCLVLKEYDGFSNLAVKALMMNHYLITNVWYPNIPKYNDFEDLLHHIGKFGAGTLEHPDYSYWKEIINNFKWEDL